MKTVNIHKAKTNLSRLLKQVQQGESFIIARAGRPVARVTGVEKSVAKQTKRLGFLAGQIQVPEDFDRMSDKEILFMFGEKGASAS